MRWRPVLLSWMLCLAAAGVASAQTGPVPGGTMPAPAPPDTLPLTLLIVGDGPAPAFRSAGPDSIPFGGEVTVVCAFPGREAEALLDALGCETPWAQVTSRAVTAADAITLGLRLTRAGPYRLAWADGPQTDHVFHVVGRLGAADQPLPVRDPRPLGWYWWRLILAVAVAVALYALFRRLRRDALETEDFSDPLPAPAWMRAAVDLCALLDEGLAARGQGRAFLDALDLIFRRFIAGRFHIKAVEMTPREIAAALRERAYPTRHGERFIGILVRSDRLRYSPGEVPTRTCLAHLREVFDTIAELRVIATETPVPAALDVEARRCWNRLETEVPAPEPVGAGRDHA